MLKTVEFIKQNSLQTLIDKYAIKVKYHKDYPNLCLLKYSQLETPMNHLTRECRGLILDQDDWRVVCYTYKRFGHDGEQWGDRVDFSNAKIFEKLDGSLAQLYYYDGDWKVATSGTPCASGQVNGFDITFKDLFWNVWDELGYKLPTDTGLCFAFELMTKYNVIVIQHDKPNLILHGTRRLSDFKEFNPIVVAHQNDWQCVETFDFDDKDAITKALKNMNGSEQEGFVACDINYNRCKLKCGDYEAKHRMICSTTSRSILDVVRRNEGGEFLLTAPQFEKQYWEIKTKYERVLGQIEGYYNAIKHIDDRKQFALQSTKSKYSGVLFAVKFEKVSSFKEYLVEMNIKTLETWTDEA